MNWEVVLQELNSYPSYKLFCLHGQTSLETTDLRILSETLKNRGFGNSGDNTPKVILLPTRADYIRRHQHESLFFQQRYQASYKDLGETVRQRLEQIYVNIHSEELNKWKDRFNLVELWDKPLLQLSSGEWQRYSVCEGLMAKPEILIVPDLLKGLDKHWQHTIIDILYNQPQPPSKILFTSDHSVDHPSVTNISFGNPESDSLKTGQILSSEIVDAFNHYQKSFLSESDQHILIQMDGVNISYGDKQILQDIHWTVCEGEKWNIQGSNGAGKSTLISLVNSDNPQGYSQPIRLFGEPYGRHSIWERKSRIAYFGSDFFQYFQSSKTIEEVLQKQLQTPYIETDQPPKTLTDDLLIYFDLEQYRDSQYNTTSSEIKRQVLLLATYMKSSDVLVLDEPYQDFSNSRVALNNKFLESVQPHSRQTVLFVTHRDDHKPRFMDRILKLEEGKVEF